MNFANNHPLQLEAPIKLSTFIIAILTFIAFPALAAKPSFTFDESAGLPEMNFAGARIMNARYDYFGENWAWQYAPSALTIDSPRHYSFTGTVQGLGLSFNGNAVTETAENTADWTSTYIANVDKSQVIGGGITFVFDLDNFSSIMGEPSLLPDNKGWTWGSVTNNKMVRMEFSESLPEIYFERGQKNQIRAKFFSDTITAGTYVFSAKITTYGIDMAESMPERFGLADPTTWPTTPITWDSLPIDLSFLNAQNKPAGNKGFLKAQGENLVFNDGAFAKFWGTNISAYSIFHTSDENIVKQAKRLSALGFNLVRLHHHDSTWVAPNIFGSNFTNTKSIDLESRRKINLWVKALKDQGIYTWLDLQVGREVMAEDGVFGFAEISKGQPSASIKGYRYINSDIQQLMIDFATDYLTSVNEYTGLSFANDPAVVTVLISNEDDLTRHFGNALLPDKNVPLHNKIYMDKALEFATKWNLPYTATWQSWLHGPSKLFLNDLEHQFNARMVAHLQAIGVKVPIITGTQWGGNGLSSLPSIAAGDMVDVHTYAPAGQLNINPVYSANITDWISAANVANKPLSVSEWNNEPFPAADRHTTPIWLAAKGSHQGWDSLLQYAYSQEGMNGGAYIKASNWHSYTDPSLLATMPAAALMFRRGDIKTGITPLLYSPSSDELFNTEITPSQAPAIRTASEIYKVQIAMPSTKELPWLKPTMPSSSQTSLSNKNTLLINSNQLEATSDTQELTRNWDIGTYQVDAPKSQAIIGFIGGNTHKTKHLETNITTKNASIIVQSLDTYPVNLSNKLLISIGTRSTPKANNELPYYVEPINGEIIITAKPGLQVYRTENNISNPTIAPPNNSTTTANSSLQNTSIANVSNTAYPSTYIDGRYHIKFNNNELITWLILQ